MQRDELLLDSFLRKLRREIKGFRRLDKDIQHHFGKLIWEFDEKHLQHSKYKGHISIDYQTLYGKFGRKFLALNDKLDIFDITEWSKERGYTKGYKLKPHIKKILKSYLSRESKRIDKLVSSDGNYLRTPPKAVASKDTKGVTRSQWKTNKFRTLVPVDIETLKQVKKEFRRFQRIYETGTWNEDLFFTSNRPDQIYHRIDVINKILKLANTDLGKGSVIHRYFECKTGRLYAKNINLQTAPKLIKQAALHGLWEYDFQNCHYAIFKQLANRISIECPVVDSYLHHKTMMRNQIAKDIGISLDDIKACLIAIIYGANSFEWEDAKIPKLIGLNKSKQLIKHSWYKAIFDEVNQVRPEIINQWDNKGRSTYMNAAGKRIKKSEPQKKILAHLVQGIEAWLLDIVLSKHQENIVLLQHDGFASVSRLSTADIKKLLKEKTGFNMPLKEDEIQLEENLSFPKRETL